MSDPVTVRLASAADADMIADFNMAMALETEGLKLTEETIRAGVRTMLQRPALGFYLVAEIDSRCCACLGITYEWSDWRNGLFWWIQSVYVTPEQRGTGVFTQMYEHVTALARKTPDVIGIRLYAERDNARAIRTYHRVGMTTTDYRLLEVEFSH